MQGEIWRYLDDLENLGELWKNLENRENWENIIYNSYL